MNWVYMLRCADNSLYTGWTNDLPKRFAAHAAGKGGKYTRAHLPVTLVYAETLPTQGDAMRREIALKRLPRTEKLRLVQSCTAQQLAAYLQGEAAPTL